MEWNLWFSSLLFIVLIICFHKIAVKTFLTHKSVFLVNVFWMQIDSFIPLFLVWKYSLQNKKKKSSLHCHCHFWQITEFHSGSPQLYFPLRKLPKICWNLWESFKSLKTPVEGLCYSWLCRYFLSQKMQCRV